MNATRTKATRQLNEAGQSLWLDNITRDMLAGGVLKRYIDELSITGLTSNPSIFNAAIKNSPSYDRDIRAKRGQGKEGEALFFELAIDDIRAAADLFRPIHERTAGADGWVSLEVSPVLARDTAATLAMARDLHARCARDNVLIKIPGTPEGLPAIEEAIFAGIPINVTLLFSCDQYVAAADAYVRGIERRIAAGLNPDIGSVASLFISRWDAAVAARLAPALQNQLGIAVGQQCYAAYRDMLASQRWQRTLNFGARPQRLLFASTGTKDPKASDVLYIDAFAAPLTVNTMPEPTLKAYAEHGSEVKVIAADGGDWRAVLERIRGAGVDLDQLALKLQNDGADSFVKSWTELLGVIQTKGAVLEKAH
jgi:transaldolase